MLLTTKAIKDLIDNGFELIELTHGCSGYEYLKFKNQSNQLYSTISINSNEENISYRHDNTIILNKKIKNYNGFVDEITKVFTESIEEEKKNIYECESLIEEYKNILSKIQEQ